MSNAQFQGALLGGATFRGALHLPAQVAVHLNESGTFTSSEPVAKADSPVTEITPGRVYFSLPTERTDHEEMVLDKVKRAPEDVGLIAEIHDPSEYPTSGQISEVRRRMSRCCEAVIFGFDDSKSSLDLAREKKSVLSYELRQPTPWNQLEAGIAFALDLPLLVLVGSHGKRGLSMKRSQKIPFPISGSMISRARQLRTQCGTGYSVCPSSTRSCQRLRLVVAYTCSGHSVTRSPHPKVSLVQEDSSLAARVS